MHLGCWQSVGSFNLLQVKPRMPQSHPVSSDVICLVIHFSFFSFPFCSSTPFTWLKQQTLSVSMCISSSLTWIIEKTLLITKSTASGLTALWGKVLDWAFKQQHGCEGQCCKTLLLSFLYYYTKCFFLQNSFIRRKLLVTFHLLLSGTLALFIWSREI